MTHNYASRYFDLVSNKLLIYSTGQPGRWYAVNRPLVSGKGVLIVVEVEGFGLDYECFPPGKLLDRLVKRCRIKEVPEMPAIGAKAMPSVLKLI